MKVQELSKKLGISDQSIYKWRKEGLDLSTNESILKFLEKKNRKYVAMFNRKEDEVENLRKKKEALKAKVDALFIHQQKMLFEKFGVLYSKSEMAQGANFMASIMDTMINGIPNMPSSDRAVFVRYRDNFIKASQILA